MKVTMFHSHPVQDFAWATRDSHLQSSQKAMAALKAMGDCGVTRESSAQGTPLFSWVVAAFQRTQEYWLS